MTIHDFGSPGDFISLFKMRKHSKDMILPLLCPSQMIVLSSFTNFRFYSNL